MNAPPPPRHPTQRQSKEQVLGTFWSLHYQRYNYRRLEHLASLGLDLTGKSVLELGAGLGDLTSFFLDRDCSVVSVEPRPENCEVFTESMVGRRSVGYDKVTRCSLVQAGIESLADKAPGPFDIVFAYGFLYHIADPLSALKAMAARCSGLLLIETCVSFGDHEAINPVSEPEIAPTQAFEGRGCRPTRPWIFHRLRELFAHVYMPLTQPAHEEFPLDWTLSGPPGGALTRAIFIAGRRPLDNPLLFDRIPDRQTAG